MFLSRFSTLDGNKSFRALDHNVELLCGRRRQTSSHPPDLWLPVPILQASPECPGSRRGKQTCRAPHNLHKDLRRGPDRIDKRGIQGVAALVGDKGGAIRRQKCRQCTGDKGDCASLLRRRHRMVAQRVELASTSPVSGGSSLSREYAKPPLPSQICKLLPPRGSWQQALPKPPTVHGITSDLDGRLGWGGIPFACHDKSSVRHQSCILPSLIGRP
jgi:hypothetical protein